MLVRRESTALPKKPNVAKGFELHGPDQLWVEKATYVAISTGFVYLAVILDAWSRKVVGYGLGVEAQQDINPAGTQ